MEDSGGKTEEKKRRKIDNLLKDSGWSVHDQSGFNHRVSSNIAIREILPDARSIIEKRRWDAACEQRFIPDQMLERVLTMRKYLTKVA